MTPAPLELVRNAAASVAAARDELVAALRQAREAGISLRTIEAEAGLSRETVRRFTREANTATQEGTK